MMKSLVLALLLTVAATAPSNPADAGDCATPSNPADASDSATPSNHADASDSATPSNPASPAVDITTDDGWETRDLIFNPKSEFIQCVRLQTQEKTLISREHDVELLSELNLYDYLCDVHVDILSEKGTHLAFLHVAVELKCQAFCKIVTSPKQLINGNKFTVTLNKKMTEIQYIKPIVNTKLQEERIETFIISQKSKVIEPQLISNVLKFREILNDNNPVEPTTVTKLPGEKTAKETVKQELAEEEKREERSLTAAESDDDWETRDLSHKVSNLKRCHLFTNKQKSAHFKGDVFQDEKEEISAHIISCTVFVTIRSNKGNRLAFYSSGKTLTYGTACKAFKEPKECPESPIYEINTLETQSPIRFITNRVKTESQREKIIKYIEETGTKFIQPILIKTISEHLQHVTDEEAKLQMTKMIGTREQVELAEKGKQIEISTADSAEIRQMYEKKIAVIQDEKVEEEKQVAVTQEGNPVEEKQVAVTHVVKPGEGKEVSVRHVNYAEEDRKVTEIQEKTEAGNHLEAAQLSA